MVPIDELAEEMPVFANPMTVAEHVAASSVAAEVSTTKPVKCTGCGRTVHPWIEVDQAGVKTIRCPSSDCMSILSRVDPNKPKAELKLVPGWEHGKVVGLNDLFAPVKLNTGHDMLTVAKNRLAEISSVLDSVKSLKSEHKALTQMIKVLEKNKP
jgi:hypothetical protein